MRVRLALALLPIGLLGAGAPALAQQATLVQPGAVSTLVVDVPPPAAPGERVAWTVDPSPGVRLFGARSGTLPVPEAGPLRIPLAFTVPDERPAGTLRVARLEVDPPNGEPLEIDVAATVGVRRRLRLDVLSPPSLAFPGTTARIDARLVNAGNAADTVEVRVDVPEGWKADAGPETRVLPAGGAAPLDLAIRVPRGARVGQIRQVGIRVEGRGGEAREAVTLVVTRDRGPVAGLEFLPATVFVGTADGPAGAVGSFEAAGVLGRDTRVRIQARRRDPTGGSPAFRRWTGGPPLRLEVSRPGWDALAGDVYARETPLVSSSVGGRGVDFDWGGRRWAAEVLVSRPTTSLPGTESGHVVLVGGSRRVGSGRLGVVLHDATRPLAPGLPAPRLTGGALRYVLEDDGQSLEAELGVLALGAGAEAATGPSAGLRWTVRRAGGGFALRVRAVPATAPGSGLLGDEISASANHRLTGPLGAVAAASWSARPDLGRDPAPRVRGASLGLRLDPAWGRLEARGNWRRSTGSLYLEGPREERTVSARADLPVGPVDLDVRAEAGRVHAAGEDLPVGEAQLAVPWAGRLGWVSAGVRWYRDERLPAEVQAALTGELDLRPVRLSGALYLRRSSTFGSDPARGWLTAAVDVREDVALVVGVDRDPRDPLRSPWTVSLGVQTRLPLPLPLPRRPAVEGVVFEDRNGNGEADPGEPGVAGVRLTAGPLETTTGADGRFRFRDDPPAGSRLHVAAASLPEGVVLVGAGSMPARGRREIPAVRTGALEVRVWFDGDGNGKADPGEAPAGGARLSLVDSTGRARVLETDETGAARVEGLGPGTYTLRTTTGATLERPAAADEREVTVSPGGTNRLEVPLSGARREVRF